MVHCASCILLNAHGLVVSCPQCCALPIIELFSFHLLDRRLQPQTHWLRSHPRPHNLLYWPSQHSAAGHGWPWISYTDIGRARASRFLFAWLLPGRLSVVIEWAMGSLQLLARPCRCLVPWCTRCWRSTQSSTSLRRIGLLRVVRCR